MLDYSKFVEIPSSRLVDIWIYYVHLQGDVFKFGVFSNQQSNHPPQIFRLPSQKTMTKQQQLSQGVVSPGR